MINDTFLKCVYADLILLDQDIKDKHLCEGKKTFCYKSLSTSFIHFVPARLGWPFLSALI